MSSLVALHSPGRGCAFMLPVSFSLKQAVTDVAPVCASCHLFPFPFSGFSVLPGRPVLQGRRKKRKPGRIAPVGFDGLMPQSLRITGGKGVCGNSTLIVPYRFVFNVSFVNKKYRILSLLGKPFHSWHGCWISTVFYAAFYLFWFGISHADGLIFSITAIIFPIKSSGSQYDFSGSRHHQRSSTRTITHHCMAKIYQGSLTDVLVFGI